jgi:nickel-type superoxide dismutase maturation protease
MHESNLKELLLWILRLRWRYGVTGASMFPLLKAGDEVLVDRRAYRQQPPQIGDIVVAQHPAQADLQIIKRVADVMENVCAEHGRSVRFHLKGDNPNQSSDSIVPANLILGRVTSKFG